MCGIAGAVEADGRAAAAAVDAMCAQMIARGPDDGGRSIHGELSLGSRRLAIIDPKPSGHQPMRDEPRGNTLVFNGMVYNYRELRDELSALGERFASDSDTEVVLKAYGRWGEACVERLRGMFAFALHDDARGTLVLARDRLGIKPLYYWQCEGRIRFASQVKALLASGVESRLSADAVRGYLATGAVPEPLTAINGVRALPAGHIATLRDGALELRRYWQLPLQGTRRISRTAAVGELRAMLDDIARQHLVSDAPLGVFLSGGLDSSLLAALAARHDADVRTISVVFEEADYSEASAVERVVEHTGSRHTQTMLRPDSLLGGLPDVFAAMDQPTFDGVNTWAVSRAAADSGLKVALSGLGADELFDGYGHARRSALLRLAARLPASARSLVARVASGGGAGARGEKTAAWLRGDVSAPNALLRALFLPGAVTSLAGEGAAPAATCDLDGYTRDVLLRDTDAMSMAHSLEVRVPYLDHQLVEWARALSPATRGRDKELLAAAARGIVPDETIARRKQGFVLPLSRWMRDELRGEIDAALGDLAPSLAAIIDTGEANAIWQRFLRDGREWHRSWALYAIARWTSGIEAAATMPQAVAA